MIVDYSDFKSSLALYDLEIPYLQINATQVLHAYSLNFPQTGLVMLITLCYTGLSCEETHRYPKCLQSDSAFRAWHTKLFRTFLVVAAERSFSVGAHRMGFSQATMSLRIQALEEKLGVRLLDRGPRDVKLTAEGRSLLPEIQALVDLHDRTVGHLQATPVVATVRLGIGEGCGASLLPGLVTDMLEGPSVARLDILCRRSGCLRRLIEARSLDLAVLALPGNAPSGRNLQRLTLHWVASPRFALDPETPVPVAWYGTDCPFRISGIAALESMSVAYREVLPDPDERVVQEAVAAGTAVTVMAEGAVPAALSVLPPHSGLPPLGRASVRLLESAGAQSEAAAAVKRKIMSAYGVSEAPTA